MNENERVSRRGFLRGLTAAAVSSVAVPCVIPSAALGLGRNVSPANRITLGFIGMGGHGVHRNLCRFLSEPDAQVLAVCDVDSSHREAARERVEAHYGKASSTGCYTGCAAYKDFRRIIEREDIDAVVISTPDHWHVLPSVLASRAGKDVLCEKPLSLTLAEGRVLADTVRRHRTVFQTGTENRSVDVHHRMCELVRNGRIGKIHTIRIGLPGGHRARPAKHEPAPVPEGFDFDLWLGPAPEAEYCEARCHWNFRWIFDYSGGNLTDWGAHLIDIAQWGNNTENTGPVTVEGEGEFPSEGLYNTATTFRIEYEYSNAVRLIVSSDGPSVRFEGSEGWIGNVGWRKPLEASCPRVLDSTIGATETHLYTCSAGEQRNFLDCVKTRKQCYAPAETAHRTISIAHIGNISMLLGRKLRWNPHRERFLDDPAADMMLSRQMRWPWHL